ncbi:MAG TPA: Ig-like domain-containing protein, partial [Candidatus Bathyarchaeia archaeon]|nr:Ig-like domain-containing protein [Candidatus Bathyarchaeia archaeon]
FIIPNLIEPQAKTYTMPELDLIELERDFQKATEWIIDEQFPAISLVPTTATIEFPDEYRAMFGNTKIVPETSHTITGEIKPWITIISPPSGAVLQNATTIHVRGSDEIKNVSLLIQGTTWEERLEDNTRPFIFEWDISDPNVTGGSYRIEATGFVESEEAEAEAINDSTIMDVKKPEVPIATLIAILIVTITAGAVAAAGAAASGMHGLGELRLKFSFHRSVLAAKFRTSIIGDLLRIAFCILALSAAYTLQSTLLMKTVSLNTPFSTLFSEEEMSLLVPTFEGFVPNVRGIFFLITALVGTVILVREVVQYFLAWLLDAEVGAIVDRTATVFMLGSGIFGHPMGYPLRAVIWEDLSPRVKGFISLGNIMGLFSLLAFFYYLSFVWYPDAWWVIWVGGVGIPAVAMTLLYSLIPFVGEEGTVIYEWNKLLSIILFVIAGFTYLSLTLNLFDPLTLQYSIGMFSLSISGIMIGGLLIYKFMGWINLI